VIAKVALTGDGMRLTLRDFNSLFKWLKGPPEPPSRHIIQCCKNYRASLDAATFINICAPKDGIRGRPDR